jgi:hypothetical protein
MIPWTEWAQTGLSKLVTGISAIDLITDCFWLCEDNTIVDRLVLDDVTEAATSTNSFAVVDCVRDNFQSIKAEQAIHASGLRSQ